MDAIQLSRRPHSSSFHLTQKPLDRCTILYTHSVPTLNVQVLSVHFVAGRVEPRGTCYLGLLDRIAAAAAVEKGLQYLLIVSLLLSIRPCCFFNRVERIHIYHQVL